MIPLRRNVNLIMAKDVYKKLGNQPDTERAWMLVRCLVGEEIFDRNFVAVPNIESALYYNQLFVFKKHLDACSLLKLRPPKFKVFDNLDNLLDIDYSPWIPQFDYTPWNTSDASRMYTEFTLFMISSPDEDLRKSIEIVVKEPHVRTANAPIPGSTVLRGTSIRAYILYIITSVVLANYVKICVCIGSQQNVTINSHVIPIGFKYRKYRILASGVLDREEDTALRLTDRQAIWMRPSHMMVLRNPIWDPMGRRHDGRRPTRNILTMSTTTQFTPNPGRLFQNLSISRPMEREPPPRLVNEPIAVRQDVNPEHMQLILRRPLIRNQAQMLERPMDQR